MVQDPYQVLGISKDATEDEIKKAYRKKAKECHPDLHPDDPHAQEKMNEVNEAYDMLKNPEKYRNQQQYSSQSSSYSNPYYGQQSSGSQGSGTYYQYTNFYDFFNDFAQGAGSTTIPMPNFEQGDSQEIQNAISYIRGQQYRNAYSVLTNMPSYSRNGRWYYLYSLTCYGMGYRDKAYEAIQKCIQLEPNRQDYQNVYNILKQSQNTYNGNPFMYQRTYRRRGHSILWYFIMFQIVMWLINMLFGAFGGYGYSRSYNDNSYYNDYGTPTEQYNQSNNSSSFD